MDEKKGRVQRERERERERETGEKGRVFASVKINSWVQPRLRYSFAF